MKKVRVILSPDAEEAFLEINRLAPESKENSSLLKAIKSKIELIKNNPHYGAPVSKELIPQDYKNLYEVTNLFHVELSNFWRMDYTLKNNGSEIEIIAFVLSITNHDKYNKVYGYKKN